MGTNDDPLRIDDSIASSDNICATQKEEIQKNQLLIQRQTETIAKLRGQIQNLTKQLSILTNDVALEIQAQAYGLYTPTYVFANSDLYKDKLKYIRDQQKEMISKKMACSGVTNWVVNGSNKEGAQMVSDFQTLLLTAFNSQCDDIISHITIANHAKSIERIKKLADSIEKLGRTMQITISPRYIQWRIEEANLSLDFAQKKQEEKERLKELRERQREEAKAQKEIEEARKKLEKEQLHYKNALQAVIELLKKNPNDSELLKKQAAIENNISETDKAIRDVDYRQANIRAGYVYVISNIGAFGENVFKIGMTRRLDPMDRIDELGDASVPFNFDVHALIFTEDAPALEAALHNAFERQKINKINSRREFFKISLSEIKKVVRENYDKTVEWIDVPPAEQYRQSILLAEGDL